MLIFGLVFAGAGLWVRGQSQPYGNGISTTGTVVEHVMRSNNDGGQTTAVSVLFVTEQGDEIIFTSSVSTSSPKPIGSQVRVSYLREDPMSARNLDDGGGILGWVFIGVGSVIVLGVVIGFGKMLVSGAMAIRSGGSSGGQLGYPSDPSQDPTLYNPQDTTWDPGDTDFIPGDNRGF